MNYRETVRNQVEHIETERVPYSLRIDDPVIDDLNAYYGDTKWMERIEPFLVRIPRGKHLFYGNKGSMGNQRVGEHLTRDDFGNIWHTDVNGAEGLETPVLSEPTLDGYTMPTPELSAERVQQLTGAVGADRDSFTIVGAGTCGLWDTCWHMRGLENAMIDSIAEPKFFEELIDKLTERDLQAVALRKDIPSDALMGADDLGHQNGVMLGPERWRKYFKKPWSRIFDAIHKQGKYTIIHCCGSVHGIVGDLIDIGLDVLQSVQPEPFGMNPYELKKKYGKDITFWGCLGSQSTIPFGTPDSIKTEVRKLKREMGKGGGFILDGAKQLQPDTPVENAVAVIDAFTEVYSS